MKELKGKIVREVRTNFITGLLVILPIVITIWLVWFLISKFVIVSLKLLPADVPMVTKAIWAVLIVILTFLGVTFLGVVARNVVGKKLIAFGEKIIHKIPIVKWIYETAKKIFETFLSQKLRVFQKAVILEYPHKGIYYIGFITSRLKKGIKGKSKEPHVSVFIPTTPNPTSGFLIVLPEKDIIPMDISIEEAMRFIISVGAIPPDSDVLKK
jgi:uncharacterized membrane protein